MNKVNLISKKFKERLLSINESLESYFNKLNFLKKIQKKTIFLQIIRFFWSIGSYYFDIELHFAADFVQQKYSTS